MTELAQQCFNALCRDWRSQKISTIPSETQLATQYGCSRTVIRDVLADLEQKGILQISGRHKKLLRLPQHGDEWPLLSIPKSKAEHIYEQLMDFFRKGKYKAGESFSELELSKQFKTTTGTVREALLKIEQYHFIHKQARQRWQVIHCSHLHFQQALEFRRIIEQKALAQFCALPKASPYWKTLNAMEQQHKDVLDGSKISLQKWLELDENFHAHIVSACQNIYMSHAIKGLSLMISLQFQHLENMPRSMLHSVQHHLAIIDALKNAQSQTCWDILDQHLELAKKRLLQNF